MSLYLRQMEIGPMRNFVYLVGDAEKKQCWIVDPAWEIEKALQQAEQDGLDVAGVLLTHAHYDHCNALETLLGQKNIPVYVHKREIETAQRKMGTGLFGHLPKDHLKPVESGDKIALGSTELTFLHTPGHTPGSQCFLVSDRLLTGDTLFIGTCGRCDLPGGSPADLFESLHGKIAKLPGTTSLLPGHNYSDRGPTHTIEEEMTSNRFLQAKSVDDFLRLVGL
ncbi:MAG: MBL fold metallo-hydrolase [Elusimicrobia bacterium]|nr:MBL fold metallo-hydrolase [Elusimicrobiota bacterium]